MMNSPTCSRPEGGLVGNQNHESTGQVSDMFRLPHSAPMQTATAASSPAGEKPSRHDISLIMNSQDSGYHSFQSDHITVPIRTHHEAAKSTGRLQPRDTDPLREIEPSAVKERLKLTSKALADHDAAMLPRPEGIGSRPALPRTIVIDPPAPSFSAGKPDVESTKEDAQIGSSNAIDTAQPGQALQRQAPAHGDEATALPENRKPLIQPIAVQHVISLHGLHENARRQDRQEPAESSMLGQVNVAEPHDPHHSRLSTRAKFLTLGEPAVVHDHSPGVLNDSSLPPNRAQESAELPEEGGERPQGWPRLHIKAFTMRVLFPVMNFLRHGAVGQYIGCNGGSDARSNAAARLQGKQAQAPTASRKRPRRSGSSKPQGEGSDYEPSDDDDRPSRKHRRTKKSISIQFACPLLKNNPVKYTGHRWKCHLLSLSKVSDVKDHVKRRHGITENFCYRCCSEFPDPEAFRAHNLSDPACAARDPPIRPDGLTSAMRRQLGIRSRGTEEEQWYKVFEIVCPGQPRPPSPYNELAVLGGVPDFWSFMAPKTVRTVSEIMTQHGRIPQQYIEDVVLMFRRAHERDCHEWMLSVTGGMAVSATLLSSLQGFITTSTDQQVQVAESGTPHESLSQAANGTFSSLDGDAFEASTYRTQESDTVVLDSILASEESVARAGDVLSNFTGYEQAINSEDATYSLSQSVYDGAVDDLWPGHGMLEAGEYDGIVKENGVGNLW